VVLHPGEEEDPVLGELEELLEAGGVEKPAPTENTARMTRGTVMALGDSCGWPWPR